MENPEIINLPPDAFRGPARGRATARLLRIHVAQTEDMEMRTYDFAPLGRSSVGFDRLFDLINSAHLSEANDTYQPYDIVRTGSDSFRGWIFAKANRQDTFFLRPAGIIVGLPGFAVLIDGAGAVSAEVVNFPKIDVRPDLDPFVALVQIAIECVSERIRGC